MEDVITSIDLATLLGLDMTDIPELIKRGLPYIEMESFGGNVKVSHKRLFLKGDVIAFLKNFRVPPSNPKVAVNSPQKVKLFGMGKEHVNG